MLTNIKRKKLQLTEENVSLFIGKEFSYLKVFQILKKNGGKPLIQMVHFGSTPKIRLQLSGFPLLFNILSHLAVILTSTAPKGSVRI